MDGIITDSNHGLRRSDANALGAGEVNILRQFRHNGPPVQAIPAVGDGAAGGEADAVAEGHVHDRLRRAVLHGPGGFDLAALGQLVERKNVITVLVKAENGTEAAYKITESKGEVSTPATTDIPPATSEKTEGQEAQAGENSTTDGSGDSITIDGASYRISEEFSDEDIPAGFERADFEYKGKPYKGISFQHGHLGMYYLVNDAGESRFFVYDADRDKFFPYVRLNSGDQYIILMVVPNAAIPPDNYKEASVAVGDWATVSAYQFAGPADKEIVKFDNPEEEAAYNAESDFYRMGLADDGRKRAEQQ